MAYLRLNDMNVEDLPDLLAEQVGDLAAAIRAGRMEEAEHILDRVAEAIPDWSHRVSVGRYSNRARA